MKKRKSIPPDICKGCRNYNMAVNNPQVWCSIHFHGHAEICPCHKCILKVMCSQRCEKQTNLLPYDCRNINFYKRNSK